MGYRLALAEKPSVAQAIAKVLGATKRCDGYLEGNGWLVSWCVGHLVELAEPESYDEKYSKWRYEDLPIFPEKWKYEVSASTRKQFAIVKQLMNREDITEIAECTDSGREGGANLPACLSQVRMQEAIPPAVDLFHGGCSNPGGICRPEAIQ